MLFILGGGGNAPCSIKINFQNSTFLEGTAIQLHQTVYNNAKEHPQGTFYSSDISCFLVSHAHANSKDLHLEIGWRFKSPHRF